MTKFYITDGKHRLLINKDNKADALNSYAKHWLNRGIELNPALYIDERGFALPEAADDVIKTSDVLRRIK